MDGSIEHPLRVLTVGDGDLSYSRCLLDPLNWGDLEKNESTSIQLTATTYDSLESLNEKYAMAASNIATLSGSTNVQVNVEHEVDATDLSRYASKQHYDRIIFHHPHSGVEDVHRHRRLLSHFFHSALQVLVPNGKIIITLARDQPERWEILKRASMASLVCLTRKVWNAPAGYTRKRHQSDKSFHHVLLHGEKLLQESTLFAFGRDTEHTPMTFEAPASASKGNPEWEFSCDICDGKKFATLQGKKTHMRMVHELKLKRKRADETFTCVSCEGRVFSDKEALEQHQLAKHGKDSEIRPDWLKQSSSNADNTAESHRCSICLDTFPTKVELDGHWKTLKPIQVEKVPCPNCNKIFEDLRALRQHQNFCNEKSGLSS